MPMFLSSLSVYPHRVDRTFPKSALRALYCFALGLVVLFPSWQTLGERLIGDEGLDVWSHAWGVRWVFNHLSNGDLPWDVAGLAHPRGGTLWYIDPLGALISLPAQWAGGPVLAHNSIIVVAVLLAAGAAMAFARSLGGRGYVAAAALATAPTFLAEIHNGTVEACWIGLVPLAGAAAMRNPWLGGAAVGLAGLATPYHGVSAALVVGTILLLQPKTSRPSPWRRRIVVTAGAAAVGAAIALPAFLALKANLDDPMGIAKKSTVLLNYPVFRINAVDPISFIRPGDYWTVKLDGPLTTPFRRTPYLGLTVLALSAHLWVRVARARLWLVAVGLTSVLALGPFLWHDGDFVRTGSGDLLALPFRSILGLGVTMDHPLRFICGAVSILAVLADVAVRRLENRVPIPALAWTGLMAGLVMAEQLTVAPNVWPINTADGDVPTVYANLETDDAVIDLPAARDQSIATNRYLYWQGVHRRPIPYSHKVGPDLPHVNPTLRAWADLSRSDPGGPNARGGEARRSSDIDSLVAEGYRWVVVHPELFASDSVRAAHTHDLEATLGQPYEVGGRYVWDLRRGVAP